MIFIDLGYYRISLVRNPAAKVKYWLSDKTVFVSLNPQKSILSIRNGFCSVWSTQFKCVFLSQTRHYQCMAHDNLTKQQACSKTIWWYERLVGLVRDNYSANWINQWFCRNTAFSTVRRVEYVLTPSEARSSPFNDLVTLNMLAHRNVW